MPLSVGTAARYASRPPPPTSAFGGPGMSCDMPRETIGKLWENSVRAEKNG
jgi:hypothetical protein